jgi:antitoxin ParD1/3/4
MRTNIVIDDQLMAAAMQAGDFKTKKDAVEEGLRLLARRKVYAAIRAARGTLHWDDSDEAWAKVRAERQAQMAVKPKVKTSRSSKSLEAA